MNAFEKFPKPHKMEVEDDGRHPFIGGEHITPTATLVGEKRPDGSLDMKPAWDRGWLIAIGRAFRRDLPTEERRANVQALADAAKEAGVPKEMIAECLKELGITVTAKE